MTKSIRIPYFSKGMKFTTPFIFAGGIYLAAAVSLVWGLIVILLGIIILTTEYVTEIDLTRKRFRDYLSFLWFPLNDERKEFRNLDRIVITKGDYAQTINTRSQSRQLDWTDYTATLLFDENTTLDLITKNDKEELVIGLKEFADFLRVGVEDRTTRVPYWIDMSKV